VGDFERRKWNVYCAGSNFLVKEIANKK
jgi:hypothetical protein